MPKLLIIGAVTEPMMDRLTPVFDVVSVGSLDDPDAWVEENGSSVDYVATNGHDGLRAEWMTKMPNLKLVSCYGVGYDAIDASGAAERGIVVTHTPNVLNAEVTNTTLLLLLACYRELLRDDAYVRSGRWALEGNAPLTRSPDGQKVGLLGMGRIGQEIAKRLSIFDAEISYHARSEKDVDYQYFASLEAMAAHVDVLIVITPGGVATKHLVNAKVLEALGPSGTLINVARGSVVDEDALIAALQAGQLGWAGLDVFEAEPKVPDALCAMPNVVLLPHVGSATVETRAAMGVLTVDNLLQHVAEGTVISPVPECAEIS